MKTPHFLIRECEEKDLNRIHEIEIESFSSPWTLNFFRVMLFSNPGLFLVFEKENEILGYIIGRLEKGGKMNSVKKIGHIMNIAISVENRGKGFGNLLLEKIENLFIKKGAVIAYLEVRESNIEAQNLYSKRGYIFLKMISNYYNDEDALLMIKILR